MFRDRHDFNAIAVSSQRLYSLSSSIDLLPKDFISTPERLDISGHSDFEAVHFFYHSKERFTRSQDLEEVRVNWRGEELFRYNMYMMGLQADDRFVVLLATPFFSMGKAVFGMFAKAAYGQRLVFHSVDLDALVLAIKEGRHEGGLIKLIGIDLQVHGDTAVDRVAVAGTDVAKSLTFQKLNDSAEAASTLLAPRKCRVIFDDHLRPRFGLATDRYGNFFFRVSRGAGNLSCTRDLMFFFHREGLLRETFAFPPARGVAESEEAIGV